MFSDAAFATLNTVFADFDNQSADVQVVFLRFINELQGVGRDEIGTLAKYRQTHFPGLVEGKRERSAVSGH